MNYKVNIQLEEPKLYKVGDDVPTNTIILTKNDLKNIDVDSLLSDDFVVGIAVNIK